MNNFVWVFSDYFGDIGTLSSAHHIEIEDNVVSVVTPARKIPLALKPNLEEVLKHMADLGINEPVKKTNDC